MSTIVIQGLTPGFKVPGFWANEIIPGGGTSSPLYTKTCLLIGAPDATATATSNVVYPILSASDADQFGTRSQLATMIRGCDGNGGALAVPGATIYACALTPSSGAVTLSLVVSGTATSTGQYSFRVCGVRCAISILIGDSATAVGDKIVAACNANEYLPVTAHNSSGTVTFTVSSLGMDPSQYLFASDASKIATGVTVAITGGTPLSDGLIPFSGTYTAPSTTVTTILAALLPAQYDVYGIPFGNGTGGLSGPDLTIIGKFATQFNTKAGPLEGRLETGIYCSNGSESDAQYLSQYGAKSTQLGALWFANSETPCAVIAAFFASYRASVESSNPSPRYINVPLRGVAPQASMADWPSVDTQNTCLNNGVSPIKTAPDGTVILVRGITTYSQVPGSSPSSQDDRVLDWNQRVMPDYARTRLAQLWNQDWSPNYTYVRDNPSSTEPTPPGGVLYPKLMAALIQAEVLDWEDNGWVYDAENYYPIVQYDSNSRKLVAELTVLPTPVNAQFGMNIRQRV